MPIIQIQTQDRVLGQVQQNIANVLNPIAANPIVNGTTLVKVSLVSGNNTIPHKLGRTLQGWIIVRNRSGVTIYDNQDANKSPEQTLVLNASGLDVVDLYVY